MTADIKLDENFVTVEGQALKSQTLDFMLDHPDRRKSSTPEYRRALVHDQNDGLTMNYEGDYPGGVTIFGVKQNSKIELNDKVDISGKSCNISVNACFLRGKDNEAIVVVGYLGPYVYIKGKEVKISTEKVSLTYYGAPESAGGAALAANIKDELVINPEKEFRGGVTINGEVKIPSGGITIKEDVKISSGGLIVKNQPQANLPPGTPITKEIDLIKEFWRLRDKVDSLEKRIKVLEGR